MDIRKVKKLIELLEESNINELEITEGEDSVRISRGVPMTATSHRLSPQPQQWLHRLRQRRPPLTPQQSRPVQTWWVMLSAHPW